MKVSIELSRSSEIPMVDTRYLRVGSDNGEHD